jgi:hypothetical protein
MILAHRCSYSIRTPFCFTSIRYLAGPTNFFNIDENQLSLFKTYKGLHGNLLIKQTYIVPKEAPWPVWGHGFRLGTFVNQLRRYKKKNKLSPSTEDELSNLGFVWDAVLFKQEAILTAFKAYKQIHGHVSVPLSFVVPNQDDSWPKETWNIRLGLVALNARNYDESYNAIKPMLEKLGFDFNKQKRDFDKVKLSLAAYKDIYGDLLVPKNYSIPEEDPFPEAIWGHALGETVNGIRNHDLYKEYREELVAMGFEYDPMTLRFQRYYKALLRYKELYGHFDIPYSYTIPQESREFEEEFWGMKLGLIYWNIRKLGYFAEYAHRWKELGIEVVSTISYMLIVCIVLLMGYVCLKIGCEAESIEDIEETRYKC